MVFEYVEADNNINVHRENSCVSPPINFINNVNFYIYEPLIFMNKYKCAIFRIFTQHLSLIRMRFDSCKYYKFRQQCAICTRTCKFTVSYIAAKLNIINEIHAILLLRSIYIIFAFNLLTSCNSYEVNIVNKTSKKLIQQSTDKDSQYFPRSIEYNYGYCFHNKIKLYLRYEKRGGNVKDTSRNKSKGFSFSASSFHRQNVSSQTSIFRGGDLVFLELWCVFRIINWI